MLKEYLAEEQDEWDQYLGCLAGAYMSTPNESTKLTPNLLALGREIRLPADLVYGVEDGETETVDEYEYIQSLKDHMPMAHEVARKYLRPVSSEARARTTHGQYAITISLGTRICVCTKHGRLVWRPNWKKVYGGICHKVKNNVSDQVDQRGSEKLLHHDKLKRYKGVDAPK